MNKNRRKKIADIAERIEVLKSDLEEIRDEEQDYLDNIPENFQDSDRYSSAEDAVDNLDCAVDAFDDILSYLEEAMA